MVIDVGTAKYNLSVIPIGGFNSTVNLQVTGGLPPFVLASIEPGSVTPGIGHSVLTIPIWMSTPMGTYNITITGVSYLPTGSIEHSVVVGLNVAEGIIPSFAMEANPAVSWGPQGASGGLRLSQGQCGNYAISLTSISSSGGSVNLTVTNQLSHVAMRFAQNSLTLVPGGVVSTNLKVCVAADAQPGNYTFTVVGIGNVSPLLQPATETHTVDILLRVASQTNTQGPTDLSTALELFPFATLAVLVFWLLALIAISLRRRRFAGRSAAGFGLILLGLSLMLFIVDVDVYYFVARITRTHPPLLIGAFLLSLLLILAGSLLVRRSRVHIRPIEKLVVAILVLLIMFTLLGPNIIASVFMIVFLLVLMALVVEISLWSAWGRRTDKARSGE